MMAGANSTIRNVFLRFHSILIRRWQGQLSPEPLLDALPESALDQAKDRVAYYLRKRGACWQLGDIAAWPGLVSPLRLGQTPLRADMETLVQPAWPTPFGAPAAAGRRLGTWGSLPR